MLRNTYRCYQSFWKDRYCICWPVRSSKRRAVVFSVHCKNPSLIFLDFIALSWHYRIFFIHMGSGTPERRKKTCWKWIHGWMIYILWPVSKIMFQTVHWMSLFLFVPTARGLMPKWKSIPVDRKTFYWCTWLWGGSLYPLPYHFQWGRPVTIKCLLNACENKTNSARLAQWRPTELWVTPQR